MSCGNPHELPCSEALLEATGWIDGELTEEQAARLLQHLDECAPCFAQMRLEQLIKGLVKKSCHCEAPDDLRQRVVAHLAQVHVTISHTETHYYGFDD